MTTGKFQSTRRPLFFGLAFGLLLSSELFAGSIQGIGFTPLPGGEVEVAIKLDGPADPQIFSTENPARIALDFADTKLAVKNRAVNVGMGATKTITAVEAGNRSRVVIDLFRASGYETRMEGDTLVVRVSNGFSGEVASSGGTTSRSPPGIILASAASALAVKNVDFRRGKQGEGRIIIDFTGDGANADLKSEGGKLVVDVYNAKVPANVAQRMDVIDFATPVQSVDVKPRSNGARIEIGTVGEFEQLAYQAGNQFVVEISPKRADENKKKSANDPPVYSGARATYNFQDIPVRSVLQLIADVSDLNIVVADTVQGSVTVRMINVPWDQALDIVLQSKGLDKRRNGNIIYVAPTKEIADREQALERARQTLESRTSLVTDFIPIGYGKAEEIAQLLTSKSLTSSKGGQPGDTETGSEQGFLSKRGSITFDVRTNTLLVVDVPAKVSAIRELVLRLDKPVQQVLIESRIVIANDSYSKELGIRFGLSGATEDRNGNVLSVGGSLAGTDTMSNVALLNRLGFGASALPVGVGGSRGSGISVPNLIDRLAVNLPVANPAGSFGFTILGNDYLLDMELSALENEGRGEVVSSPRVITASSREAFINQTTEIPYLKETVQDGIVRTTVEFKKLVLQLKATPTISPDQRIFMNLEINQDTVNGFSSDGVPGINTRVINTAVLVDNGQTVVLGGILEKTTRDDKTQVPFLGDLPVVGSLFKTKARRDSRTELLIFVTPKILQDSLR